MDLRLELKESKILLSWANINADYYKVFFTKDTICTECAVTNENMIILSLAPYGEGECFVKAYKDDKVIETSSKRPFIFDTVDIVTRTLDDEHAEIFYSSCDKADEFRLFSNENEEKFNACKDYKTFPININYSAETEYQLKPFTHGNEGIKNFLTSSNPFRIRKNGFKSVTLYKSYNFNLSLSWDYEGYADGFAVYTLNSKFPVYEVYNRLSHNVLLTEFKSSTKFIVKAFVNTFNGRIFVAESKPVSLLIRKYEKPDVSLIIPAYNSKNYIARSIDSALASDFDNLEIVIVNDGSSDDTQKIIDWYDKNYPNVVSIKQENGGVADARGRGIEASNGEFIAFMDDDDLIRPDMISSMYNSIVKNDCDVVIAPVYAIMPEGYSVLCSLPFLEDVPYNMDKYLEIMYTSGYYNCMVWNKMYRNTIVKEHLPGKGLRFDDVSWTPCVLSYADKFCYLKSPLYEWDRKSRPETYGDVIARASEEELFEHRKQALLFFIQNGNPNKKAYLKVIAKRRLECYIQNSSNPKYNELIEEIDKGKY